MAVVLVVALAVANLVTYSSLRSYLYGRLDDQIDGAQLQAYNYLTLVSRHATSPHIKLLEERLDERVSPDIYVTVLSHAGQVLLSVPSGPIAKPDPAPKLPASLRPAPVPRSHHFGAFGGAYHSESSADVGSVGNSGVRYRESAVDVPQGVLVV